MSKTKTRYKSYYEILELRDSSPQSITLTDIKKSYRRLALKHHPDRNNNSPESTKLFQLISIAYECLSDKDRRRRYDSALSQGDGRIDEDGNVVSSSMDMVAGGGGESSEYNYRHSPVNNYYHHRNSYRNAYSMFDDLFQNDPFFSSAFQDIDDEFSKRFQNNNDNIRDNETPSNVNESAAESNEAMGGSGSGSGPLQGFQRAITACRAFPTDIKSKGGLGSWLLDKMGVQFTYTSYSNMNGNTSVYRSSNYDETQRTQRTYVQSDGKKVTVQSLRKGNNQIEDTYVEGVLVQRKVNGHVEPMLE